VIFIDTNVFVRLLVDDDAAMAKSARDFVAGNRCRVSLTVLLEANWVFTTNFKFEPAQVLSAFEKAIALPELEFDHGDEVVDALASVRAGLEMEDALHLASLSTGDEFATFDKQFARRARRSSPNPPVRLLQVRS